MHWIFRLFEESWYLYNIESSSWFLPIEEQGILLYFFYSFLTLSDILVVFRVDILLFCMNYQITPYKCKNLSSSKHYKSAYFLELWLSTFDKNQYNRQMIDYYCCFNLHFTDYLIVGLLFIGSLHFLSNSCLYSLSSFPIDSISHFIYWKIFLIWNIITYMIDAASSPSCHLFLVLLIGLNFEWAVQILYLVVYSHYFLFLKGFLTPTFYSSCY